MEENYDEKQGTVPTRPDDVEAAQRRRGRRERRGDRARAETLRYELSHFVCEGQYKDGIVRILESYVGNINSATQLAAWISGFYGSGKSHLEKMLRHLWVDTQFPDTGETARGLAHLPAEVKELLKELDTLGKRYGGLHAAVGALPAGGGLNVRLAVLSIVFRSKGLPESLPQALFCLWLKKAGIFDKVKIQGGSRRQGFLQGTE